mgnify:CR=1 FL=1
MKTLSFIFSILKEIAVFGIVLLRFVLITVAVVLSFICVIGINETKAQTGRKVKVSYTDTTMIKQVELNFNNDSTLAITKEPVDQYEGLTEVYIKNQTGKYICIRYYDLRKRTTSAIMTNKGLFTIDGKIFSTGKIIHSITY